MVYFEDKNEFDNEMKKVKEIIEIKGYILESDHRYAYSMQYNTAFNDISSWLKDNGYNGKLSTQGYFDHHAGAVYGLYDTDRISYEKMHRELVKEAKRQSEMC